MSQPPTSSETHPCWHALSSEEALMKLQTSSDGLSAAEAKRRQEKFGLNQMTLKAGTPAWVKFLQQFNQPLVYLLLIAVFVTALLSEWVDSSVIFGVVLINAIVGYLQESKAEKAIESLANLITTQCKVKREGKQVLIPSQELVPGDYVLLQAGDSVPGDLRLISCNNLQTDESTLTGESLPVQKSLDPLPDNTVLADRMNLVFTGTLVTAGQGEGIVYATGNKTETGNIAQLISNAVDLSTPLTRKIAHFSKILLWIILGLAAFAFFIGILRGESSVDMFIAAVALAVGAIPEGLPAAVTIVLAIGVSRMAQRRAIIRKLPAVETLGSTTIICSDKTGTLTENQMTVQEVYANGQFYALTGSGYDSTGEIHFHNAPVSLEEHHALSTCLRAGMLCNDSALIKKEGKINVQGDPTEAAMLVAGMKAGFLHDSLNQEFPRLDVIPFESETMYHASLHEHPEGRCIYVVGAVEKLFPRCVNMLTNDGSQTPVDLKTIRNAVDSMASHGLRVLALAQRFIEADSSNADHLSHKHIEEKLTFIGLQGMMDPPRQEAITSVQNCQKAGIQVKMITGDHLLTARAIASLIGIKSFSENSELGSITGQELEKISDEDLPALAERTSVFARVAPEQKLRLVLALQSLGHVIAMTGDGVNDAPALKQADIGIAMGVSGTEVAKSAADMILTDDNFASIEAAVEEGRGVFDNLTKFIVWTLPTNIGEALILLTAIILGTALPALPVQLLWINMTTAIFLGLMLVFEEKEKDLMNRPPRPPQRSLLTFPLIMRTGLVCLIIVLGAFWLFFQEMRASDQNIDQARTAVINVVILVEIAYLLNCRSLHHSLFSIGIFSNLYVIWGILLMLLVQLFFTYAPIMNLLFHTAPISFESWTRILLVAFIAFVVVEVEKYFRYGKNPHTKKLPE